MCCKVEVEQRALKAIKCEAELASARVAQAEGTVTEQESRVASGEATKQELDVAKTALAQLVEAEEKAVAKRETPSLNLPKQIYGVSKDCLNSAARTNPT